MKVTIGNSSNTQTSLSNKSVSVTTATDVGKIAIRSGAAGPAGIQGPIGAQGITGATGLSAAGRIYYFKSSNINGISGYEDMSIEVSPFVQDDTAATANVNTGPVQIVAFSTVAGDPSITNLPAGEWEFHVYRYVSQNGYDSTLAEMLVRVYKRASNGAETLIFSTTSNDIPNTDISPTLQVFNYVKQTATAFDVTDRLVIKFLASAPYTGPGGIDVHHVHDGALYASFVRTPITVGYVGDTGAQGALGSQGSQGTQGTSIQGTQGTQGLQGLQGTQGTQGTQGLQ